MQQRLRLRQLKRNIERKTNVRADGADSAAAVAAAAALKIASD